MADAGGTSTDWYLKFLSNDIPLQIKTAGINATTASDEEIRSVFRNLLKTFSERVNGISKIAIYLKYFGAGCNSAAVNYRIERIFSEIFCAYTVIASVRSDIYGAALSLFGKDCGIACVLGTGSASCCFKDGIIVDSIPSLGYVLGDEGSGAYMGKTLLNMYFKRELPLKINERFNETFNFEISEILRRVYRCENANAFLASFVPFISENRDNCIISQLIDGSLKLFYKKNVLKYKMSTNYPVRFVGGVASLFKDRIIKIAHTYGLEADMFVNNPIFELGKFYTENPDYE